MRTEIALRIWQASAPTPGKLVEIYLRSRGLNLPLPASIRFHAGLKHPTGGIWPAMIGLVTRGTDDAPMAVHRTFLARDGVGKAPVVPAKMMLGPCRGGAVRLAPVATKLAIAECIESALSVQQASGVPTWAALSTSGVRVLVLPPEVKVVLLCPDGDEPGEQAVLQAAKRFIKEGRRVRIAYAPPDQDYNDLLQQGTGHD